MRHVTLVVSMLLACGCGVDPAPAGIENVAKWTWVNYDAADDEAIADAIVKLHAETKNVPADEPVKGSLDVRLSAEDLAPVGLDGVNDPSKARGLLAVTIIECPLAKLEPLVYALNQDEQHPDSYDAYKRTHTSDLATYQSREADTLTWTTELTATVSAIGSTTYSETLSGGVRWVPDTPHGPVLLSRTWLTQPATFEEEGDDYFRQDYQIEIFYERAPGETVHVFGVWREMRMLGFDMDDDVLHSTQLGGFIDWDEQVEELCQG